MSRFYNPVRVYFGAESVESLAASVVQEYQQENRVLLLTRGSGVEKAGSLQPLMQAVEGKDVLLKELQLANPDLSDIVKLKKELDAFNFGLIIAIGGGSVMDVAKTLAALQHSKLRSTAAVRMAITEQHYRRQARITPWIGIPTTSGTGSEVTSWATVWDEEHGSKHSIADERLYACNAVILPELTARLPLRLSAVTALDAMCHATEAYWSVRTNPISRMYAIQAIERIRVYLPRLKQNPESVDIRMQLALASLYAGLAFSNTSTTACHSISYPLTLQYGIEHGVAASFTLGAILQLNRNELVEPEKLLKAFGAQRVQDVQPIIFELFKLYGIPTKLRDYGLAANTLPAIVARAHTKGRMDNNPVEIAEEQVLGILENLL